jgi:predicted transcriptional regulator
MISFHFLNNISILDMNKHKLKIKYQKRKHYKPKKAKPSMHPLMDLLDPKLKRILKLFLKNKSKLYHLQQLSQEANVAIATALRIVKKLTKQEFIEIVKVGKLKIYRLAENGKTKKLLAEVKR